MGRAVGQAGGIYSYVADVRVVVRNGVLQVLEGPVCFPSPVVRPLLPLVEVRHHVLDAALRKKGLRKAGREGERMEMMSLGGGTGTSSPAYSCSPPE
jgi:hypothetical protein